MPDIRRATSNDISGLADLMQSVQAWHADAYPKMFKANRPHAALTALFTDVLADANAYVFVAGAKPQGYLFANLVDRRETAYAFARRRLMIEHIGVAPGAQRGGIGRALITAAQDQARALDCDEITLDTWAANTGAHGFFRSVGFENTRLWFQMLL